MCSSTQGKKMLTPSHFTGACTCSLGLPHSHWYCVCRVLGDQSWTWVLSCVALSPICGRGRWGSRETAPVPGPPWTTCGRERLESRQQADFSSPRTSLTDLWRGRWSRDTSPVQGPPWTTCGRGRWSSREISPVPGPPWMTCGRGRLVSR